jgi:hypothetical protein
MQVRLHSMIPSSSKSTADTQPHSGMGVMLATIWIHLGTDARTINDRLSVHFYSVAFLSFSKSSPEAIHSL